MENLLQTRCSMLNCKSFDDMGANKRMHCNALYGNNTCGIACIIVSLDIFNAYKTQMCTRSIIQFGGKDRI